MKKIIIAALLITSANFAFAQSNLSQSMANTATQSPSQIADQKAHAETDKLVKSLDLNTDQKVKIQAVNSRTEIQLEHIRRAGPSASPDRTKHILMTKDQQYKTILTADQYKKYEQQSAK